MKIKEQVCTQKQAFTLDGLFNNYKKDSYFKWIIRIDIGGAIDKWIVIPWDFRHTYHYYPDEVYNAYTSDELMSMVDKIQDHDNTQKHPKAFTSGIIDKIQTPENKKLPLAQRLANIVIESIRLGIIKPEVLKDGR